MPVEKMSDEKRTVAIAAIKAAWLETRRTSFLKFAIDYCGEELLSTDISTRHKAIDAIASVYHELSGTAAKEVEKLVVEQAVAKPTCPICFGKGRIPDLSVNRLSDGTPRMKDCLH